MLKIIHTSDWHLGRSLYGRKRYDEFQAFLDWLTQNIIDNEADLLLICGDVFDTNTPSNTALELYYNFLHKISTSNCKHVIILAGNHDSPSLLEAPKYLLQALNIHIIGQAEIEVPENDLLHLKCNENEEILVCAVPYLRERDLRKTIVGEDRNTQHLKMLNEIKNHYDRLSHLAKEKQDEIFQTKGYKIPIISTGHLFAAGGQTLSDDGVRDLYVGSLLSVGADVFSDSFDYVALGHLHLAQNVNKNESISYSGSPIPMGFDEANKPKQINLIEFNYKDNAFEKQISHIEIPCFQELIKISGDILSIKTKLFDLIDKDYSAWLEIEYLGQEIISDLSTKLYEIVENSQLEIIRIRNSQAFQKSMQTAKQNECLIDLNEIEVFERCLEAYKVLEEEKDILINSYHEILNLLHEQDKNLN